MLHRLPELLRNPGDASALEGFSGESVTEKSEIDGAQRTQSCIVKSVARRHEEPWMKTMASQNGKTGAEPFRLLLLANAGEFCICVKRDECAASCSADVPETV